MQWAETEDGHGETLGPQHACEERARLERLGWYVYEAAREDVPRAPDPRPQTPGARATSPHGHSPTRACRCRCLLESSLMPQLPNLKGRVQYRQRQPGPSGVWELGGRGSPGEAAWYYKVKKKENKSKL